MGIQGLLPLLKSIQRPTELKKFSGETFGVDTYGWLHKGAISCAVELAQGKPTRKYVDFAMHRVRMLKHFGITPYMVFDGDYLPSKADTEASRERRREESKKAGLALLKAGKPAQAYAELQKAIDITPEMARHLIEELKKAGVPYVVAPYEADPQLVYLERQGVISGILSEDSDLLVFGAKRLLTKLDQHGGCIEINRRDFCACREVSLTGWTDTEFRQMAILSGCDYLDSVPNLGLKTAYRLIRKHKTPEKAMRMLQFDGKYRFPADYPTLFRQAELTFLYQWVFCPKTNKLVNFTEPGPEINLDEMPYIGPFVEHELAKAIATGDVNPITKQQIVITTLPSPRKRTASGTVRNTTQPKPVLNPPGKPIDSYFNGHRRIPLGEMEPNCFSVDPNRLAAVTDRGNRSIVFPLPRPYLDESGDASATSRSYINRPTSQSRTLRRRTEPLSNLLSNGGYSLSSASRRQTVGSGTGDLGEANRGGGASSRALKKVRLCDDASEPNLQKSKFFPSKAKRTSLQNSSEGYLKSDDSVEEALKELPDVDGWNLQGRVSQGITVFTETDSQASVADKSKDDEPESNTQTDASCAAEAHSEAVSSTVQLSQTALKRFSYTPKVSNTATTRSRQSLSSVNTPCESTPASSAGSSSQRSRRSLPSSQASTARTTPATPLMTPLQRLGAQAINRTRLATSPTIAGRHVSNRPSKGRPSIDSIPLNPSFVPLPAVDVDEVEALHKSCGSEDLLPHDSENEDSDGVDNGCSDKPSTAETADLSRFLFGESVVRA
ncbi:Rad2 nuclease [Diatrype stigma]|uniref:Rad2 nuclease n=1 Tax=Diatrype stigma TaxID=117547 RepID=A0AAN9YUD8_9PEZI